MTEMPACQRERPEPDGLPPQALGLIAPLGAPDPRSTQSASHYLSLAPGIGCQIGRGGSAASGFREPVVLLSFACHRTGAVVSVAAHGSLPSRTEVEVTIGLTLEAWGRAFGDRPQEGRWHMSRTLRAIVVAMGQTARRDAASSLYLKGKGLELVCETVSSLTAHQLVPCSTGDVLSEADTTRILRARALIEERHSERLTLHAIALACGINRTKLTKGFNALFGMTVAQCICATRMISARDLLLTTDLPITTISVRCGYWNNASFSRAFARHFGMSPVTLRSNRL